MLLRLFYFREARIGRSVGWLVVQSVGCLPILHIVMPVLSLCLVFPITFITFILLLQLDSGTLLEIGIGSEQKETSRPFCQHHPQCLAYVQKGQQLRGFFPFFLFVKTCFRSSALPAAHRASHPPAAWLPGHSRQAGSGPSPPNSDTDLPGKKH